MLSGTSKRIAIGVIAVACAFTNTALASTAGAAKPSGGPQAPFTADFFGMSAGAEITNLPDPSFDREMNLMEHMGVHWIRAVFPWSLAQAQDASPADEEWTYLDRLVNYAGALGMQVDAIVD